MEALPLIAVVIIFLLIVAKLESKSKRRPRRRSTRAEYQLPSTTKKEDVFYDCEHTDQYYNIIQKWRNKHYRGPGEWHHIIPVSMGGEDKKDNLVKVSFRTHLYLHHLLPDMCIYRNDRRKMIHAIVQMRKESRYDKPNQY